MCHRPTIRQINNRQRGSMLVMAMFAIIVLALLAATLVNTLSASSQTTVVEVLGTRALHAAQSGLDEVAAQAFPLNATPVACNATVNSPAALAAISGLQGCSYQAQCTTTALTIDGSAHNFYRFRSIGVCSAGDTIVSRTLEQDAFSEVTP